MKSSARKIIVDSRYFLNNAPAQSGTFELPETITLHDQDVLYLQQFHCMCSWYTVDSSNDTIYLIEQQAVGAGIKTARIVKLIHGPYDIDSLASQLETQLNDISKMTVTGNCQIKKITSNNFSVTGASSAIYRYFTFYLTGGGSFLIADYAHVTQ